MGLFQLFWCYIMWRVFMKIVCGMEIADEPQRFRMDLHLNPGHNNSLRTQCPYLYNIELSDCGGTGSYLVDYGGTGSQLVDYGGTGSQLVDYRGIGCQLVDLDLRPESEPRSSFLENLIYLFLCLSVFSVTTDSLTHTYTHTNTRTHTLSHTHTHTGQGNSWRQFCQ